TASRRWSPRVGCSNTDRRGGRNPPPLQEGASMLLRHATLARNHASICRAGLLSSKSQGKLAAVWLHSPSCSAWAGWHTIRRHGGRIEGVVILELDVPRSWLRRSKKGLWYCPRDIPAE